MNVRTVPLPPMARRLGVALAWPALALLAGCASMVAGDHQNLTLDTRHDGAPIAGARCALSNDKGTWHATSPGWVTVQRSFRELSIACTIGGGEPGLAKVHSSARSILLGNLMVGGLMGTGVDFYTGAAFDYPGGLTIELGRSTTIGEPWPSLPAAGAAASARAGQKS